MPTKDKEKRKQYNSEYYQKTKCPHTRDKYKCKDCNLQLYLINLQRIQIARSLINNRTAKPKQHIEYLDCSPEYLRKHIKTKMVEGMTFQNIHIDHIKPVSAFNLEDPEEFLKCCHYTNIQPLYPSDNIKKRDKWTEENELYWNNNIIYKDYNKIYL
jgi:hypothetical protein